MGNSFGLEAGLTSSRLAAILTYLFGSTEFISRCTLQDNERLGTEKT